MTVYLGADHGGFELKEALKKHLDAEGYKVIDCGTDSTQSVDYAPIAEKTCLSVLSDDGSLGILCCGTGIGMSMAANRSRVYAQLVVPTISVLNIQDFTIMLIFFASAAG